MRNVESDRTIATRKVGAEDIIMMRLPAERFQNSIPRHYTPMIDSKSRYQVALLAQACMRNSFDNVEAGRTYDLQFWLQVGAFKASTPVKRTELMLPDMHWLALRSATSNIKARDYLQSFGFNPLTLEKTELGDYGGSVLFPDGGRIEWSITGPGKKSPSVGVNHVVFMQEDGPETVGHHITALLSDAVLELPGRVHIQTRILEPFLNENERFAVIIHRMTRLEADVTWQLHAKYMSSLTYQNSLLKG